MMKNRYFKVVLALILLFSLISTSFWIGKASHTDDRTLMEKNLQESEQELKRLEQDVLQSEEEIEQLKEDLQRSKKEIDEFEKQIASLEELEAENEHLKSRLDEKKAEISSLEESNTEKTEELDELQRQLNETSSNSSNESESNQSNHQFVNIPETDGSKKVFLTFDDGPTTTTPDILDTLNEYDVNATFFTIGQRMEKHPEIAQRTYYDGNMILTHSYTHDYAIYESFDRFYNDLELAEEAYENVLGFEAPKIIRFPGGSSNHSSFDYGGKQFMPRLTEDIKERGYHYIDWNVSSGDAGGLSKQPEAMLDQIKHSSRGKDLVVALFHDTAPNQATADILPKVIEFYKEEGYKFRTFRDITDEELNDMVQNRLANKPIVR
ncbi:polysaccharide deacetylase family protein [Salipaludibacillus daqingensis]|uniref:polysaccharide deacetylase family protein n=1 Tax=Salipaludibacillus daqingensis TaxID=3041001 RepID=UPI0024769C50|nr:polysaccharide deacetylase family protein [Salipaludibacillus daqingensis]